MYLLKMPCNCGFSSIVNWSAKTNFVVNALFFCSFVTTASILQVHFKYLAFKDRYYSKIIKSSSIVILKHILGLIL